MTGIIGSLYAGGTRGVRVFNLSISMVWLIAAVSFYLGLPVDLPEGIVDNLWVILCSSLITVALSISSFTDCYFRTMHKYISLHTGSFLQSVIGVGYAIGGPPLPVPMLTSFMFALWLLGAAYFVMDKDSGLKRGSDDRTSKSLSPNNNG